MALTINPSVNSFLLFVRTLQRYSLCACIKWILEWVFCPAGPFMLPCEIQVSRTGRGVTQMPITDVGTSCCVSWLTGNFYLLIMIVSKFCRAIHLIAGSMTSKSPPQSLNDKSLEPDKNDTFIQQTLFKFIKSGSKYI